MRRLLIILAIASAPAMAQSTDETGVATPAPSQPPPAPSSRKWFRDPGVSRSLFAPTGFTLKYGERLIKLEENYLAFELGVADHFSIELGTLLPSPFWGIYGLAGAKWGADLNEQWHVAVSAMAGVLPFGGSAGSLVGGLATVTYGSPDANVTFSAGAAFGSLSLFQVSPLGEVALYYRLTENLALETEHWFMYPLGPFSNLQMAHAGGVRVMFESVAIHAGAMGISAPGGGLSLWPWVGLTWLTTS